MGNRAQRLGTDCHSKLLYWFFEPETEADLHPTKKLGGCQGIGALGLEVHEMAVPQTHELVKLQHQQMTFCSKKAVQEHLATLQGEGGLDGGC
jgi:hypothetical protein